VASGGVRCACGGYGHLTTVASAQSLVRMMIGRLVEAPAAEAAVMALTGGRAEALTAPQIWQLACEGDSVARDLMDLAVTALAIAVIFHFLALDVERVIIGGALAQCGDSWLAALREQVALSAPPTRADDLAGRVVLSELRPAAILRGTGALAQRAI
ncbi:MAG TPA: ROK family protein, partial [Ktedonobacterales bacterium]|nr:ROK family protein [Ktedonobacterales bacterium]